MGRLISGSDYRLRTSPPITIGVDVGQKVDPTAIAVTETFTTSRPGKTDETTFEVRVLERLPIGTSYPAVAERLTDLVKNLTNLPVAPNHAQPTITMLIDSTGVGAPVVDLMRDALRGTQCRLTPVTFVHGEKLTTVNRELRMGKGFLVSRLDSLLQTGRVKLPANHPEADVMLRELQDYETRITDTAKDVHGAFKTGAHDDLVTALGLAVLRDRSGYGAWST